MLMLLALLGVAAPDTLRIDLSAPGQTSIVLPARPSSATPDPSPPWVRFSTEKPTKLGMASESVTGKGQGWYLSPEFTLSPRWRFQYKHASLNLVYHGEYTFNMGLTTNSQKLPSGPVTSRRQNPQIYLKLKGIEDPDAPGIKVGWAHESNGMYINKSSLRDTLQRISVFSGNLADHYNSMGWNYNFVQWHLAPSPRLQIYLEDRFYHNQSCSFLVPFCVDRDLLTLEDTNFSNQRDLHFWNLDGLRLSVHWNPIPSDEWLAIFTELRLPSLSTNLVHLLADEDYGIAEALRKTKLTSITEVNYGPRPFQGYFQVKFGYANHITNYSTPVSSKIRAAVVPFALGAGIQSHIK